MGCSWDARSGSSSRHLQWLQWASVRPSATLSCCIVDTPSLWREEKPGPRAGGDAVSSQPAANASASGTHAAGAIMPGITRDHSGIADLSEAQDPFTIAADVLDSWSVLLTWANVMQALSPPHTGILPHCQWPGSGAWRAEAVLKSGAGK
jgi:hypothetical protein